MNIKIREARAEDAREINEVFKTVWLTTYPNEKVGISKDDILEKFKNALTEDGIKKRENSIKQIKEDQKFFVATRENKVVGVCSLFKREEFNQLQAIYVLSEFQGKGIGKMFWQEAIKFFNENKKIIVQIADYNIKAIKFYESLGFKDTGKRFIEEKKRMPISKVLIPEMEMEISFGK